MNDIRKINVESFYSVSFLMLKRLLQTSDTNIAAVTNTGQIILRHISFNFADIPRAHKLIVRNLNNLQIKEEKGSRRGCNLESTA